MFEVVHTVNYLIEFIEKIRQKSIVKENEAELLLKCGKEYCEK